MAAIKHWGRRYDAIEEHICSMPACMRGGIEIIRGQVMCASHLNLRLEVTRDQTTTGVQLRSIRRLGDQG